MIKSMAVNIHNLIAAVSPDVFCDSAVKDEVKKIAKEKGYLAAAEKATPREYAFMDLIDIEQKNAADSPGLKAPIEKHLLIYDSFGESLEPIYFWIIDKMNDLYKKTDKLVDNFISSAGSGHFSETGMKQTKMQEEGMKMLGAANQVIKSILNIIYDLKEFKLRLAIYDDYRSGDKVNKEAALLSLKQIWMDTVDMKKGNSAIAMLVRNFDYVTLYDAFMAANSVEQVTNTPEKGGLDLNERVRRIAQQRVSEFFRWIDESERELRKRFEIERIYLKSQVNTVKLYARWAKPYLRAARQLEQNASPTASLVTSFNTALFELTILGESDYKPQDDVAKGDLPKIFLTAQQRKYAPIMIVEFRFRSSPERSQQGYGFRGRADVTFTSYALNEEEIAILRKEIEKDDIGDVFKLIEGATQESLNQLADDLTEFINEKDEKKKEGKTQEETNPFSALFSLFKKEDKKDMKKEGPPASDNRFEKIIRSQAIIAARKKCYLVYDLYKKAHAMPTMPDYS